MFDVLTYQKGGERPAHARAVPRRHGLPGRRAPLPAPPTPTPTRSRPTCGTPSRRRAAAGARGHGLVDPPGRPPGGRARDGSSLTQGPFSYGAGGGRRARSASAGRCRSSCAPSAAAPPRRLLLEAASGPGARRSASRPWSTPAGGASTGSPTAEHLAALAADLGALRRSSGPTCSPTPGPWCWPAASRSRRSSASAARSARTPSRRPSPRWPAPWRCATGRPTTDPRRPWPRRPAPSSAPPAAARAGSRRPARASASPACAPLLVSTLGTIGKDDGVRARGRWRASTRRPAGRRAAQPGPRGGGARRAWPTSAGQGDYDAFLARYRTPRTPQEEQRYLRALASFPDVELGTHTFDLALHDVRTQDAPYLIIGLLTNRVSGPAVFEQLTDHWDEVLERFPVNSHSRMLQGVRTMCGDQAAGPPTSPSSSPPTPCARASAASTRRSSGSGSTSASSSASAAAGRRPSGVSVDASGS